MTIEHCLLPALLGLRQAPFHEVKKALAAHGVSARGWRLYADYGDALLAAASRAQRAGHRSQPVLAQALALLRLLAQCETDVPPPFALLASTLDWDLPDDDLAIVPAGVFRAFWKACAAAEYACPQRAGAANTFIRNEIVPCARWYFGSGQHLDPSPSWRNASWSTIRTRWQQALHRMLTSSGHRPARELPGAEWPVFIPRIEYDGLAFQALHNEAALQAEGKRMSNCVGSYANRCRTSMLRVYAITHLRSDRRMGTVSVTEDEPGRWTIDELEGPGNQPAPTWVEHAADAIVRSLADAYHTRPQIRREMEAARARATRTPSDFEQWLGRVLEDVLPTLMA